MKHYNLTFLNSPYKFSYLYVWRHGFELMLRVVEICNKFLPLCSMQCASLAAIEGQLANAVKAGSHKEETG